MSALFRQHVCCRHAPKTNPLYTPPSIPPSTLSIFVLRTSRLPGCRREPQVNKKIEEASGRAAEGGWWVVGGSRWCNRCGSSSSSAVQTDRELWAGSLRSAPLTFPLLCPAILSSPLTASVLAFLHCSALLRSLLRVFTPPPFPRCDWGEQGATVGRKTILHLECAGSRPTQASTLLKCPWGRDWTFPGLWFCVRDQLCCFASCCSWFCVSACSVLFSSSLICSLFCSG